MKIGIDLGTTNSALAFIDSADVDAESPPIHILDIPQYVAQGVVESRPTLPSFLFLGDREYIGIWAREQGALAPTRSVHSAKSWLSNPEVDRTAKILPWDAPEAGREFSPVDVSARFLAAMREAWDKSHAEPLAAHDVVLTVPASFDEEARELTVEAARQAGIEKLTLLEEPAAAFYSWIANHLADSRKHLFDGQTVLVCDVGGGTSDFTLIRVARDGDRIDFTRTAVGRHLLLGGDNLDLTLAWLVESKLAKQLSIRQRSALRRQCAAAKERLLAERGPRSVEITVLGGGSALIGGTLRTEVLRDEALELTLDGFLPFCSLDDRPAEEQNSMFRESGLPYVSDPAVTRHLSAFLATSGGLAPDAVLFNGGFFIPEVCRRRVVDVVERWYGRRPLVFENHDLHLAVAVGAAYYALARTTGTGVLVRGGLPRAYYIGIGVEQDGVRAVCLVPRGAEEGALLEVDTGNLQLVANKPVSFRLYSSLARTGDSSGEVVTFSRDDAAFHLHAPLEAVIRFGKPAGEQRVPVKITARLTEVGTLEIWCESKISDQRWRLQFELRKQAQTAEATPSRPAAVVSEEALVEAERLLKSAFVAGDLAPEELPAKLEAALSLGRTSWPLGAIRRLADLMLDASDQARRSAAHEARWLNLCGLSLRPGFGYPGDDLRVERARRACASGFLFQSYVQNEIEWWIFWGRLAGGLSRTQQAELYQNLSPVVLPHGEKKQRVNESLRREMWRTASSLELLPVTVKTDLGEALLARVREGDFRESELWCLSRLGARALFYGPLNHVIPPATAGRWVDALLGIEPAAEAAVALARVTGNATLDLAPAVVEAVRRRVEKHPRSQKLLAMLSGDEPRDLQSMGRVFGEELPSGLVFAAQHE